MSEQSQSHLSRPLIECVCVCAQVTRATLTSLVVALALDELGDLKGARARALSSELTNKGQCLLMESLLLTYSVC